MATATHLNVLSSYRGLLKLSAKLTPEAHRIKTTNMIKAEFRKQKEAQPDRVGDLLTKANSTLGYLKIVTPKYRKDVKSEGNSGVTTLVFGDSNRKQYGDQSSPFSKVTSNWTGGNMDPDSVKRHERSLKRSGFKSNSHAKGGLF